MHEDLRQPKLTPVGLCRPSLFPAGPAFRKRERMAVYLITLLAALINPICGPRFGLAMNSPGIILGTGGHMRAITHRHTAVPLVTAAVPPVQPAGAWQSTGASGSQLCTGDP